VKFVLKMLESCVNRTGGRENAPDLETDVPLSEIGLQVGDHRLGAQGQRRMGYGQLILIEGVSTRGSLSRQTLPDDCIDPRSHASAWLLG
jgi:hypothetical protein